MITVNFHTLYFEVEDYASWVSDNRDIFYDLNNKSVLDGSGCCYLYPSYPLTGGTLLSVNVSLSDGVVSVVFSWFHESKIECLEVW